MVDRRQFLSLGGLSMLGSSAAASSFAPTPSGPRANDAPAAVGFVDVFDFLTSAEMAQVRTGGAEIDLAPRLVEARAAAKHRPIYLRTGLWSVTSFDIKGYYGGIVGDGALSTILMARTAVVSFIDATDSDDVMISPFLLRGLSIHGNGKAANLIDVAHRHYYRIEGVLAEGATTSCLRARDSWNNVHVDSIFRGAPRGVWLVGSNHRNAFYGCTFSTCSKWQLEVDNAGSQPDGNEAILLSNCDVESGLEAGGGILFGGSSIDIDGYTGENIAGPVLQMMSGIARIAGTLFYGFKQTSVGIVCNGGKVVVSAKINPQVFGGFATLAVGNGGKVLFRECLASTPLGGNQVMTGDPLDNGPAFPTFASRSGRNLVVLAGSAAETKQDRNGSSFSVAYIGSNAGSRLMGASALLLNSMDWLVGQAMYLVVVYRSNQDIGVRLVGTDSDSSTFSLGTMPSTKGALMTYVKLDNKIPAVSASRIDFYVAAAKSGDFLTIEQCIVADSRMLDAGAGTFGNLYKC